MVKGAGIASIVLAIVNPPVGLVASVATFIWARRTGMPTTLAVWGMIVAVLTMIIMTMVAIWVLSILATAAADGAINMEALCQHRDSWGWLIDSLRYACR
ncbi:MAG TPA: hypothetical protein PKD19_04080 [Candidatus Saccharibacteria bacterium]|nr:hypothetical protein [Candidatus Saccharibacteria bacterium]HMR38714.1 hypothetical protein [Candidatus Saccharibacteria bacterium]